MRFNETLYYYLISHRSHIGMFSDELRANLASVQVQGFSLYEVFGSADVLLRAWLNPNTSIGVNKLLKDPRVSAVAVFRTSEYTHWGFPDPLTDSDLLRIDPDAIRRAQDGDTAAIGKLSDLRACRQEDIRKGIKVFIAVDPPQSWLVPTVESIKAFLRTFSDEKFDQKSVYIGDGFAWAIVKGVVRDFFDIRGAVRPINDEISRFLMRTTTFISDRRDPQECEFVSESSLTRWDVTPDPDVFVWLPELYQHRDREFRRQMEDIARRIIALTREGGLTAEGELTLRDYLSGVIGSDVRRSAAPLAYWFPTVEARLLSEWIQLIEVLEADRPGTRANLYASLKMSEREPLGFGQLIKLLTAAISVLGRSLPGGYHQATERVVALRNQLAHGRGNDHLLKDWRGNAEALLGFMKFEHELTEIRSRRNPSSKQG